MNFVFIMTDSQGANIVGCYGRPEMRTPNIDRLAGEGIRFENAYTTCPVCTPARAGIFTGLYPSKTGAWTNNLGITRDTKTMGERFKDNGYDTALIGKWHLDGHDYFDTGICPPEWDDRYWFDGKRYLASLSENEVTLWRQKLKTIDDLREHHINSEFTWAHRSTDRAVEFLSQHRNKPFLLVVSYDEPHGPATCPPEYAEHFRDVAYDIGPSAFDDLSDKPAHHRIYAEHHGTQRRDRERRAPLSFGCNSFVDYEIGRVLDAVDRYSPEDTCVIYTSDHGDMMGAHGLCSKGPAMYHEITRIPLIMRLPKKAHAGKTISVPVSHVDIMPTMLSCAGIAVPLILDGSDLIPVIENERAYDDRAVLIEFHRHSLPHDSYCGFQPIRCITDRKHKFVINLLSSDELYDLSLDAHELVNRIEDPLYADVRERMHSALLDRMDTLRDPMRGDVWFDRPWNTKGARSYSKIYRPKPPDGYSPPALLYGTGREAIFDNQHDKRGEKIV